MSAPRVRAPTEEDTRQLGERLAHTLPDLSDTYLVVHLHGDLGAGKTTLVRALLQARGVTGPIRSPTYTLVEIYELPGKTPLTAVHLDLYRLADPSELEPLGLTEWARAGHLWLIEWPDRGGERLPPADVHITLTAGEDAHWIDISAASPLGERWTQRLL